MALTLDVTQLTCGYDRKPILHHLDFSLAEGQILTILGANGVGKTTLFRTLLGFTPPLGGTITLNDQPLHQYTDKARASLIGYVPQAHSSAFAFRVRDIVVTGRLAHKAFYESPNTEDYAIADAMIEKLDIASIASQVYAELSGGQQQLVLIARALTQQPRLLVLDEPTANLDVGNTIKLLQAMVDLASQHIAIIMTSHNPDHAFLCHAAHANSKVLLLKNTHEHEYGNPETVITESNLQAMYGIAISVHQTPVADGMTLTLCTPNLHLSSRPSRLSYGVTR